VKDPLAVLLRRRGPIGMLAVTVATGAVGIADDLDSPMTGSPARGMRSSSKGGMFAPICRLPPGLVTALTSASFRFTHAAP